MDKYFCYRPSDNEFCTFLTLEEAKQCANEELAYYESISGEENGWNEEVQNIAYGEILFHIAQVSRIVRDECKIDENGYDEENDLYWNNDFAEIVEYAFRPTSTATCDRAGLEAQLAEARAQIDRAEAIFTSETTNALLVNILRHCDNAKISRLARALLVRCGDIPTELEHQPLAARAEIEQAAKAKEKQILP
jgi:hypothetical protein